MQSWYTVQSFKCVSSAPMPLLKKVAFSATGRPLVFGYHGDGWHSCQQRNHSFTSSGLPSLETASERGGMWDILMHILVDTLRLMSFLELVQPGTACNKLRKLLISPDKHWMPTQCIMESKENTNTSKVLFPIIKYLVMVPYCNCAAEKPERKSL